MVGQIIAWGNAQAMGWCGHHTAMMVGSYPCFRATWRWITRRSPHPNKTMLCRWFLPMIEPWLIIKRIVGCWLLVIDIGCPLLSIIQPWLIIKSQSATHDWAIVDYQSDCRLFSFQYSSGCWVFTKDIWLVVSHILYVQPCLVMDSNWLVHILGGAPTNSMGAGPGQS